MKSAGQVAYRLKLAEGFLREAHQDIDLLRWRSAMDNSQLVVENSAKAILSILGPVGRTHYPASLLRGSVDESLWQNRLVDHVLRLAELTELLGFDIHMQTDYGDEIAGKTPWELFDEADALQALNIASDAFTVANLIVDELNKM